MIVMSNILILEPAATLVLNPENLDSTINGSTNFQVDFNGHSTFIVQNLDLTLDLWLAGGGPGFMSVTEGSNITLVDANRSVDLDYIVYTIDNSSSLTYSLTQDNCYMSQFTTFDFANTGDGPGGLVKILQQGNYSYSPPFSIQNLTPGSQILLEIDNNDGTTTVPSNVTFIQGDGSSKTMQLLDNTGNVLGEFNLIDGFDESQGYSINNGVFQVACFLRDTRISTPMGHKAVQDFQAGDQVLTASGNVATVKWVGYRKMHTARIPANMAVQAYPIRIAKSALAPNTPIRDLYVSPNHHLYFDGMLVPAMLLVNGQTITQEFSRRSFEYVHLELDRFDILLAEGVASESYVDTGNRAMFQNAPVTSLLADFGTPSGRPQLDHIEIVKKGPKLETLRLQLLKRAEKILKVARIKDPDLHLNVNGQKIRPLTPSSHPGRLEFSLPTSAQYSDIEIVSRFAVARETTTKATRDLRHLGVCLTAISIREEQNTRYLNLSDEKLKGLHPLQNQDTPVRWTSGAAIIPAEVHHITGNAILELHIHQTYSYWKESEQRVA
jgi:preprotein translocase subunit YajC